MDFGEPYFYFEGTANKQNMPFCGMEPPENAHEETSNRRKVAVWGAMSSQGLIGTIFFLMKQQTLNDICLCSETTSCRNLRNMACPYRHSTLCKMVPRSILPTSCWTWGTPFLVLASCQIAIWIVTSMGTLGQLSFLIWILVTFHRHSWRRSSSPMGLRQDDSLLSCVQESRKTCVAVLLRTRVVDFKKSLEETVATWNIH